MNPIDRILEDFRNKTRIKASSLVISFFGDVVLPRGGQIWLGSLIKLLEPLGLSERLVRTTVFRLVKDEWLSAQAQGRRTNYKLTPSGKKRFEEASNQIYAGATPTWDKQWRIVMVVGELQALERERIKKAFYWQGFGQMNANCFIHPSADLLTSFSAMNTGGMSKNLTKLLPLIASNPLFENSANDSAIVHQAWDLGQLNRDYVNFVNKYKSLLIYLQKHKKPKISSEHYFLIRLLLIHDFRRLLLRDPELPQVLLPAKWPGHAARLLTKNVYQLILKPSELHLNELLLLANGDLTKSDELLFKRFH